MRFRTAIGWSLVAALVVLAASGVTVGQGDAGDPCEGILTNGTTGEPGEALAGAIGEQEAAIDSELADRRFDARLRNASSDAERAEIIAAEFERLRTHVESLEACAEFVRNESDEGDLTGEALREHERALATRANATAARINETAAEARSLPADIRRAYGIDEAAFDALRNRTLALREEFDRDARDARESDGERSDDGTVWPWR